MAIRELRVSGYRSVRDVTLELEPVNIIVGPNGSGKTNLYRAMYLLFAAARGRFARSIVDEGGMPSALWAGRRGSGPVRMTLGATIEEVEYTLVCGLPPPASAAFALDPQLKEETIRFLGGAKPMTLLERGISSVMARDADGRRLSYPMSLDSSESVLAQLREPHRFPQLSLLRQEILNWRFYHHFDTSVQSPLRSPQVITWTPILDHDGRDLASAVATLCHLGNGPDVAEELEKAFPGATLAEEAEGNRSSVGLKMPNFQRAFTAHELSDGTLRYLCLLAALLSPRPPTFMALNEPETSLHPDLLEPLGGLIARAARDTQLLVTTHSEALAAHIAAHTGALPVQLRNVNGETRIAPTS